LIPSNNDFVRQRIPAAFLPSVAGKRAAILGTMSTTEALMRMTAAVRGSLTRFPKRLTEGAEPFRNSPPQFAKPSLRLA